MIKIGAKQDQRLIKKKINLKQPTKHGTAVEIHSRRDTCLHAERWRLSHPLWAPRG